MAEMAAGKGELKEGEEEIRYPIHYTSSAYTGTMDNYQPESEEGEFHYPTGTKFVGPWKDGMADGVGIMYFPGAGKFRGLWKEGKAVDFPEEVFSDNPDPFKRYCYGDLSEEERKSLNAHGGRYLFTDNLEHVANMWRYGDGHERRFYAEAMLGKLDRVGEERMAAVEPAPEIPEGQYDVGDGFYDPETLQVTDYKTGAILRYLHADDHEWATVNCRASPSMVVVGQKRIFKEKMQLRKEREEKQKEVMQKYKTSS